MARRIQYHRYGGPEVLHLEEFDPRQPGPGEVLVDVRAASTNPMDAQIRAGALEPMTGRAFPRGYGHDFAGLVVAVGAGIDRLQVGDEVLGGAGIVEAGAFADLVTVDATSVVAKPARLSFEDAASLPTAALTAWQALFEAGGLQAGQAVFVIGCLGAVGRSAVQLARAAGATVSGSCRPGSETAATASGVAQVEPFDFDPAPLAGRFDVILDTAGQLDPELLHGLLRPDGHVIDIHPTPAAYARSATSPWYRVVVATGRTEDLAAVADVAARGGLRLPITRAVPLERAVATLREREQEGGSSGKIVITADRGSE